MISTRGLGVRLLLLLCSVLLAALFIETGARILFPHWAPRTAFVTQFWQYDARYGWSHVPGASGRFRSHGIDTLVTINSKGFRGPEMTYARNSSGYRILLLGDSLTWGFGVGYEETFGVQLERLFPQVETVNLAVSGYSTDQELLLYRDEGGKYRADLVVVVVAYNDNSGNGRTVEYMIYGKPAFHLDDGRLQLVNQPVAQTLWLKRAVTRLAWQSYVLTSLHRYLNQPETEHATQSTVRTGDVAASGPSAARAIAAWGLTVRLLLELKKQVAADGADLLVVFADGIPGAPALAEHLGRFGVDSLVLDKFFDADRTSLYLPDRLHWTPTGHRVVAMTLAEWLRPRVAPQRQP